MARYSICLLTFSMIYLASCQAVTPENKAARTEVASFLEKLKKEAPAHGITKVVTSQGESEETKIPKPNLEHELAFFSKAALSDAYLNGFYTMTKREEANLSLTTYTAKGDKPEVRQLDVIRNIKGEIIGLHLEAKQDNYLYQNTLNATVFSRPFGSPQLKDYRIEGTQQMLFGKPYQFDIYAKAL